MWCSPIPRGKMIGAAIDRRSECLIKRERERERERERARERENTVFVI